MTLQEKIKANKESKQAAKSKQEEVLAANESYVNYLADMELESEEVTKLDAIITELNGMKAIIAQDGTKYAVHCYPVAESTFGPVGARLIAISTIAGAMFTTERQIQFSALTGIPYLIALDAANRLGKPAYVTKSNQYVSEVRYKSDYIESLTAVAHSLGLDIRYAGQITEDRLNKWFTADKAKANNKMEAIELTAQVDEQPFTLND